MYGEIVAAWDGRLVREQTIAPDLIVPQAAAEAMHRLADRAMSGEADAEWLDLLGRNALQLTDLRACVTLHTQTRGFSVGMGNASPEEDWGRQAGRIADSTAIAA